MMDYLDIRQAAQGEPGSAVSARSNTLQAKRNPDGGVTLFIHSTVRYAGGIEHHADVEIPLSVVEALQLGAVCTGWMEPITKG